MGIILLLPVELVVTESGGFTTGIATQVAFMVIITLCLFMLFCLIKSHKQIIKKEFVPIIALLLFIMISTMIQASFPQLLLFI